MRVLAIAAHPDDEVLGCGGTLARHARQGDEVTIAILGEGLTSRFAQRNEADEEGPRALQDTCRKAGKLLGAGKLWFGTFPDNRFDTVPLLDVVKFVEGVLGEAGPAVVYTHHGGDLNVDHAVTARAVLTATRPVAPSPVRELLTFEIPSSTEWAFHSLSPEFRPNVFIDIGETLERKIAAMQLYTTETRPFPHPRSEDGLRAAAQRWGTFAGVPAAEAFQLVRSIR
jgi:LmbE family N-acetylglucosaminyl deacetylase